MWHSRNHPIPMAAKPKFPGTLLQPNMVQQPSYRKLQSHKHNENPACKSVHVPAHLGASTLWGSTKTPLFHPAPETG